MIEFHLDARSGIAPDLQAHPAGTARPTARRSVQVGHQLPTVKEVVGTLAINPNTVSKAYRELRVTRGSSRRSRASVPSSSRPSATRPGPRTTRSGTSCTTWVEHARGAGLDEEGIEAVFRSTLRSMVGEPA